VGNGSGGKSDGAPSPRPLWPPPPGGITIADQCLLEAFGLWPQRRLRMPPREVAGIGDDVMLPGNIWARPAGSGEWAELGLGGPWPLLRSLKGKLQDKA
jgi:hypothetical protein